MFNLTHKLPKRFWVAVSGGVDSMAVLHWLNTPSNNSRINGVIHINHNTGTYANSALKLVLNYCLNNNITFKARVIDQDMPSGESKENWWRQQRYKIFGEFDDEIILAHHLDDCVEEYVMCTMVRGFASTISYRHGNCIRPFRLWRKKDIRNYADRNKVPFIEDPSNLDNKYKRNFIRNEFLPIAYKLNPGLHKIVAKLISKG